MATVNENLHKALHTAREATRNLTLQGVIGEGNVNPVQLAITEAMKHVKNDALYHLAFNARADLEHALDAEVKDPHGLVEQADTKVATALGEYHGRAGGCSNRQP